MTLLDGLLHTRAAGGIPDSDQLTGEILHADGGYHAMASTLANPAASRNDE